MNGNGVFVYVVYEFGNMDFNWFKIVVLYKDDVEVVKFNLFNVN